MNYYNEIKQELVNHEIYARVKDYSKNKHELETYYNVGKLLIEAQGGEKRAKYGDGLIKEYSKNLMNELDKKYSERNLRNMRQFYILSKNVKWNAVRSKLTWTHYRNLLKIKDVNEIYYYIRICEEENLSTRDLQRRIKLNEYGRLSDKAKDKLARKENIEIQDLVKNPIIIHSNNNYEKISEKVLKTLILDDISSFLKEL